MHDPNSLAIRDGVSKRLGTGPAGPAASVVDLGCGGGLLLQRLIELGFRDIAGVGWTISVPGNGVAVPEVDLTERGWADRLAGRTFDWIVATEVLEHLVNPYQFLVEARRLAHKNSRLVLTFPNVHNFRSIVGYALNGRFSGFFGPNWNDNHPLFDQHIFVPNMHLVPYLLKQAHFELARVDYLYGTSRLFSQTTMIEARPTE
jgi:SAM-dependent methyltransferase